MKIHKILCEAVVTALFQIFKQGEFADKVIEKTLKSNPKWGARDRAFIAENTYEIVRYARKYQEIYERPADDLTDWWQILGIHLLLSDLELPPFGEFQKNELEQLVEQFRKTEAPFPVRASIPDWLDDLGRAQLGPIWEPTMEALNTSAPVVLRANILKTTVESLQTALQNEGFETEKMGKTGLHLLKRANIFRSKAFQDGWFEIQDAASQLVAESLDVKPGMRVVDACAGAGGKSLHLAALMQNKGNIIALDTIDWKLKELAKRAKRAGVDIIEPRLIQSTKVIKRLTEQADRLLLDVPCSGLGVLRRNPDAKWKLKPETIGDLQKLQASILDQYSRMLKPGGKMVYATCSILPSENTHQVQNFLTRQEGKFELLNQQIILPQEKGFDGFYIALLQKI